MLDHEAGEADIELLTELDMPIVVAAARRQQRILDVPQAVSIISAEDIRRSGARTVPDALRLAPGVDVADISMVSSAVSPRGFHGWLGNYALVLVDGRQIYDSFFGGTLWDSWGLRLEDIERIEVIRGPGGVAWGANAMNGVINIVTKDPADQTGLIVKGAGGSRGYYDGAISYGVVDGGLRLRLSGSLNGSDGFRKGGSFLRGLEDGNWKAGGHAHARLRTSPDDVFTFSAGSYVAEGVPLSPIVGVGLRRKADSEASYLFGKWTHTVETDNEFSLTAYVNDFHGSNGHPAVDYRYQQFALQLSHNFKPSDDHTMTWGIDTRLDLLDATNSDPFLLSKGFVSNPIAGVYVQDEWKIAPRWMANLGARLDYDAYGGFQPSARGSLAYEFETGAVAYAAVSRSFYMPVAASRFLDLPLLNGIARVTSDRDIRPTSLIAYEFGYRQRFSDRFEGSFNLFGHEYDGVATFGTGLGPPGLIEVRHDNRADASLYGIEADAPLQGQRPTRIPGKLYLPAMRLAVVR
jgi:iron complex outermembrane receptor protein